jgi:choline dehydrogenase
VPKGTSGITLNSYTTRPKSRGTVRLRSGDPSAAPLVDPNFLAEPSDLKTSAEGVRISKEIFSQPSLMKFIRRHHLPGDEVRTQADFEAYARQYGRTSYHPCGTCRMGVDDLAVVDPQLRLRGLDGIRVCDSSVMPSLIGSNTNAPTIMIAEKASDLVRGNR